MKHIKKYNHFLSESYKIEPTDAPEFAVDKTSANKLQNDVKEFLAKKTTIDNIYMTYHDEKDLMSKLYSQKFIPTNTSNKKDIRFTNPLIGFYAQVSEKKRELRALEEELQNKRDDLNTKKSLISSNPDTKESLQSDVEYVQSKINDTILRISKLKNEIISLERDTEKKLKEMKTNMESNRKRLDYSINNTNR